MKTPTRDRILDAATDLFGTRGVDAVSLDVIATEVGVAKQTLLYWFPSKDDLVQAVLVAAAPELSVVIDAAVRAATDDPLDRIEAVIRAVFRPAVRRPAGQLCDDRVHSGQCAPPRRGEASPRQHRHCAQAMRLKATRR